MIQTSFLDIKVSFTHPEYTLTVNNNFSEVADNVTDSCDLKTTDCELAGHL